MKIVYNPKDGAPISSFISQGVMLETHYPDGYEKPDGTIAKGMAQYNDFVADEILETYTFLSELTPEKAKELLARPDDPRFKCDFPNCDFASTAKIAVAGHKKTHAKEIAEAKEPVVDSSLIPIAGGKRVPSIAERKEMRDNGRGADIPNGADKDGVDWYGEGVQVENRSSQSFGGVRQAGKGHFVG
jgi:hypothetical protein